MHRRRSLDAPLWRRSGRLWRPGCAPTGGGPVAACTQLPKSVPNTFSALHCAAILTQSPTSSATRSMCGCSPRGQIYYDRDMARAIMRGDLDFAAPTISTLSRIVPECSLTALPPLYGQSSMVAHRITDGPVGREMARRLERKLGAARPRNGLLTSARLTCSARVTPI